MKITLACVVLLLAIPTATSQTISHPERVTAVKVWIGDDVKEGCWPRPAATKEAVALVFRSAGVLVADSDRPVVLRRGDELALATVEELISAENFDRAAVMPHVLYVTGRGYAVRTDSGATIGCAVAMAISVSRAEALAEYSNSAIARYLSRLALLTGPKRSMQRQITDYAVETQPP